MSAFLKAVSERRTIYGISKDRVVSEDKILEIVNEAVKHTPSAFNSQSSRVVVLFGDASDKLWDMALERLRAIVPAEAFEQTAQRIGAFRSGYGTVLFFEDQKTVANLQEAYALYKDNFPVWSNQASGMLQFVVWTALEEAGLGANLQHYNPLVDADVQEAFGVDASWKLIAQMPFGKPVAPAGERAALPLEDRVRVVGA